MLWFNLNSAKSVTKSRGVARRYVYTIIDHYNNSNTPKMKYFYKKAVV